MIKITAPQNFLENKLKLIISNNYPTGKTIVSMYFIDTGNCIEMSMDDVIYSKVIKPSRTLHSGSSFELYIKKGVSNSIISQDNISDLVLEYV